MGMRPSRSKVSYIKVSNPSNIFFEEQGEA